MAMQRQLPQACDAFANALVFAWRATMRHTNAGRAMTAVAESRRRHRRRRPRRARRRRRTARSNTARRRQAGHRAHARGVPARIRASTRSSWSSIPTTRRCSPQATGRLRDRVSVVHGGATRQESTLSALRCAARARRRTSCSSTTPCGPSSMHDLIDRIDRGDRRAAGRAAGDAGRRHAEARGRRRPRRRDRPARRPLRGADAAGLSLRADP